MTPRQPGAAPAACRSLPSHLPQTPSSRASCRRSPTQDKTAVPAVTPSPPPVCQGETPASPVFFVLEFFLFEFACPGVAVAQPAAERGHLAARLEAYERWTELKPTK